MKHYNYNKDKHGQLQTFEDHQINFSNGNMQPPKDVFILVREYKEPSSNDGNKIPVDVSAEALSRSIIFEPSNKANKILGVSPDDIQPQTDTTSTSTTITVSKFKFKRDMKKLFITNKKKVGVVAENDDDDDDDTSSLSDTSSLDIIPMRDIPMVNQRHMKMEGSVCLPHFLNSLLNASKLNYFLLIGRPSGARSAGLHGYKEVTTRKERKRAPILVVIDKPNMLTEGKFHDSKYLWSEIHLGDAFMLDVSQMKSMDDYKQILSKNNKKAYKNRNRRFNNEADIEHEWAMGGSIELPADFVNIIWSLYKQTGEKNGYTVLTKEEFFKFHQKVPNLIFSLCWDASDPMNKKLVSFCTGLQWKDVLMPLWCGTDYSNPLHRSCTTYFIMHYNFIELGINNPHINWIDLGMSQRKAKTAMGFSPVPCSGYFRSTNRFSQHMIESFNSKYYDADAVITDA